MRSVLDGYRIENGEPVIEPREADRVRAAFASFAKNGNLAQALRDSGIQKNHPFMSLMLKNPRYKGDDFYPEIIDGKTFDEVQAKRKKKKRPAIRTTEIMPGTKFRFLDYKDDELPKDPVARAAYVYERIEVKE